ncbi:MAG: hypothetical protein R3B46_11210 [Phycisphaerales bacterium]
MAINDSKYFTFICLNVPRSIPTLRQRGRVSRRLGGALRRHERKQSIHQIIPVDSLRLDRRIKQAHQSDERDDLLLRVRAPAP